MGICVLGPPQVDGAGALAPRDRLVLGALAVRRQHVVLPEQLADAVWGEHPPESWTTQVQICVARLRKVVGTGSIETVGGGYRLALAADEVDADRFEALVTTGRTSAATAAPERAAVQFAQALGLWRGSPFVDLNEWEPARSEAARLEELHRTVEEDLADARLASGEHKEVAATAEALVAAEPLRERRWAMLALAQYRCGRQADALRTLARARRILVEQLGIDPGPELVELEAAILSQDEVLAAPPSSAISMASDCPYKGLVPYDIVDGDLFFGREGEVAACLERLRTSPLLVVAGPSGCGKSSLVRAGLIPALASQGRPSVSLLPGDDPHASLHAALASTDDTPVVIVDQFEELFALGTDVEVVREFCRRLAAHAVERAPVVLCVRADHLGGLSIDPGFARLAEHGLYLIGPLTGDQLRDAVEQPAQHAGLRLEPGLVNLLLRDCDGEPGALPLLSHALVETWRRREGRVLTVDGYQASGGIRGAVARSADHLYDSLPTEQRAILRGLMLRFITPTVDGDPVRCRVPTASLVGDHRREQVVAELMRARLVTAETDTVELAHEALARAWPRLRSWLDDDAAGQRTLRHLATAAAGWDSLGRPHSELYRGARLDAALEWRATAQPDLTRVEAEFLDASSKRTADEHDTLAIRAERDARQNRRLRAALAGVGVLAVLALVAALIADRQRDSADASRRASALQALVSDSVALRTSRPELAALLAAEAHRLAPSAATESALLGLFTSFAGIGRRVEQEESLVAGNVAKILPDGETLVTADLHGVLQLFDIPSGTVRSRLGTAGREIMTPAFAVTADGRYLATSLAYFDAPGEGTSAVTVWDLETGRRRFPDVQIPFLGTSLAIDAAGTQLAVGGGLAGRVALLDASTGTVQHELQPLERPADAIYFNYTVSLGFSPDDELLVGTQAGPVRVIDADGGEEVRRIDGAPQTAEGSMVISHDGRSIVTQGALGVMRYDLAAGRSLWIGPDDTVCQAGFAVAERLDLVLCAEFGGRIIGLDLESGGVVGPRFDTQRGGAGILLSPDGTMMLSIDLFGYTVWRLDGSGLVHHPLPYVGAAPAGPGDRGGSITAYLSPEEDVRVLGYLPDGHALLVATATSTDQGGQPVIDVVDARSGAVRTRLLGARSAVAGDQPGHLVALFDDDTVSEYDLQLDRRVGTTVDLGFAADELVADDEHVYAWSYEGRLVGVAIDRGVVSAPDIELDVGLIGVFAGAGALYTISDNDAFVLERRDPRTGAVATTFDAEFVGVEVAAGEHHVIANTEGGELITLDPATMRQSGEPLPDIRGLAETMVLSDDGGRLLVLGADRDLRLYDIDARAQLGTDIAVSRVAGAAIRADGLEAAVVTDDGIVIWDLDPQRWLAAACTLAGRNLTRAEWDTYIADLAPHRATCPEYDTAG